MTYVLSYWCCIMTVLWLATCGYIACHGHWVSSTTGKECITIAVHIFKGVVYVKPLKCPRKSYWGCCNHWCHQITCLRNAQWTSLLTCLSPSGVVMQLQHLWIICLNTYILCLVRVRFLLKNSLSCSFQPWCCGMECLSGSYLIAMAGIWVSFGSRWWVRLAVT